MQASLTPEPSSAKDAQVTPPPKSDLALEADRLTVHRGGKRVLHAVSFGVQTGEIFAILGGNGAGKSTTLLTFLGFLPPSEGCAQVQGGDVSVHTDQARRAIAYLPEAATLYGHLSARENLSYLIALTGRRLSDSAREETLDE